MAFLDNSGDIILDAVLTDTGRMRLAKGDGSFNITKFALGDDEINYELYDKNHASGSAYYDIEIVQTPVLEAFTNNTSMMKSKLMTISRTNLLYLPQIVNNTVKGLASYSANNILTVFVDQATAETGSLASDAEDYINGYIMESTSKPIVMDQGIKSNALGNGKDVVLANDLKETQYTIEIDNRFGKLWSGNGAVAATPSFVDDDDVAVYYLTTTKNSNFFTPLRSSEAIAGPRGSRLQFLVGPSTNLNSSTYLFTQLGTTSTLNSTAVYQIDTTVRITGVTTGYRVDLPIRFVKAIT
jgi:hypothetical protein